MCDSDFDGRGINKHRRGLRVVSGDRVCLLLVGIFCEASYNNIVNGLECSFLFCGVFNNVLSSVESEIESLRLCFICVIHLCTHVYGMPIRMSFLEGD